MSDIASLMKIYMTLMEIYKLRNHMTGLSYSMSDVKFSSHMVLKVTSSLYVFTRLNSLIFNKFYFLS